VAGDPTLSLQFRSELARRAEFDIIREELIIDGVGAPLDNDAIRLQHEPRHHTVFTAPAQKGRGHSDDRGNESSDHVFGKLAAAGEDERDGSTLSCVPIDCELARTVAGEATYLVRARLGFLI
jgi:hypothetical protein